MAGLEEDRRIDEEIIERIADFKPYIAAFSLYTCQYNYGRAIAKKLKKMIPEIVTIAGSRYPTFLNDKIEYPFDIFVIKEGEATFKELIEALEYKKLLSEVKGIAYRENGRAVFTGLRERISNIDEYPFALRFSEIYSQPYRGISIPSWSNNPKSAIIEYSRCCYNNCSFCDNAGFWGNKTIYREVPNVIKEMKQLKEKGIDIFYFMDLNFTADEEKAKELCQAMISEKLNASWYCMSNVSTTDRKREMLELMKKAGCYKIAFGVESTSDNALLMMNKKVGNELTTNDQANRVLMMTHNMGFVNQGFYIIGFPWETSESILADAKQLVNMPLHQLNIGIFTPIPLSRFHKKMMEEGYILDPNLERHDRNHLIYNHKSINADEMKEMQELMYREFYQSKEYKKRIIESCEYNPDLRKAFSDYFEHSDIKVEL